MAGFENRDRRGQDPNAAGYPPPPPYGGPGRGRGPAGRPAGGPPRGPARGPQGAPYGGPQGPYAAPGEPEYFEQAPAYDDAPGHTRAFTMGEPAQLADPYAYGDGYADGGGAGPGYADGGGYANAYADDNVATYRAGQSAAPPSGPRLHWKQLLSGIVLRPGRTFWQMRDHTMWTPALTVTFVYGLLAVFGFDSARHDVLGATLSASIPLVVMTAVAVTLSGVLLSAVTTTLARQLGGDGAWAPTVGLALLVTAVTDAPRLFFALFLGGANSFVQLLGWLTWLACVALMTSMVAKSHDLPWPKALGASAIQLIALLMLFKLPLI
ncbi:Yip1 family protein [Streptomyces sp. NRRL F-5123]|uniref:Yip1 family protein n=1 Tax=Streptomyces sp. NRRL F-5123 TaxID=1463856 RepID=UPI0005BB82D2|nr:Yip1 family protein [Streptomyces sp. NRRL F-5123]